MATTTYSDAYIDGFCKAAESAGVDPVSLVKVAAPWWLRMVGKGIGAGWRGSKRFGGLLLGGKTRRYDRMMNHASQRMQRVADEMYEAGHYGDLARLSRSSGAMDRLIPLQSRLSSARAREARKVMAARVAGVGALGAGALGYAPAKDYFGGNPFGQGNKPEEYDHEKTYYGSLTE